MIYLIWFSKKRHQPIVFWIDISNKIEWNCKRQKCDWNSVNVCRMKSNIALFIVSETGQIEARKKWKTHEIEWKEWNGCGKSMARLVHIENCNEAIEIRMIYFFFVDNSFFTWLNGNWIQNRKIRADSSASLCACSMAIIRVVDTAQHETGLMKWNRQSFFFRGKTFGLRCSGSLFIYRGCLSAFGKRNKTHEKLEEICSKWTSEHDSE